jgi:hypothetical protein
LNEGDYPDYDLPPFADRDRSSWSRSEGREYLKWIQDNLVIRTDFLLEYVGLHLSGKPTRDLLEIETRVCNIILEQGLFEVAYDRLYTPHREFRILNGFGVVLALDTGLLLSRIIRERFPNSVQWKLGSGSKREYNYNDALLVGTASNGVAFTINPLRHCVLIISRCLSPDHQLGGIAKLYSFVAFRATG